MPSRMTVLFATSVSSAVTVLLPTTGLALTSGSAPLFEAVGQYSTTLSGSNTIADIYYPNPPDLRSGNYAFPIALLLQGALVDKSFYSDYASQVAKYGFVVVVPNNLRPAPLPGGPLALLPETSQVNAVIAQVVQENVSATAPIAGIVDTQKLGLLGHSFGAAVGLSVIANQCLTLLCREPFTRPPQLKAGVFLGANLRDQVTGEFIPIANDGIGVALLQGDRDSVALPELAQRTYEMVQTPPQALLSILGTNHFGITNINNPPGAQPDRTPPTLDQPVAVETIARWSALFLRATMLNDPAAATYVFETGDALDPNVTVTSAAVPEPTTIAGLLTFGVIGVVRRFRNRPIKRL